MFKMKKIALCSVMMLSVALLSTARSFADLVVVMQTDMKGMPAGGGAMAGAAGAPGMGKTVTRYKDGLVRTENGNTVTIIDAKGKVTTLDLKAKTYYVADPSAMMDNPMVAQIAGMMDVKMDVDVQTTGEEKTILGQKAQKYTYEMVMKMGFKEGAAIPGLGGGGEGGGPPKLPTIIVSGEQWSAAGLTVTGAKKPSDMMSMMGPMADIFGKSGDIKEKLARFEEMKGYPLTSKTTVRFEGGAGMPGVPTEPMTTNMRVMELKTTPQPAELFKVPKGFKKIEPPMMGMGGF
jgi:hypothetical protein